MIRPRCTLRWMVLAVMLVGLLLGAAELVRRNRRAALLPPPPPWAPASIRSSGMNLYVNMDDVRAGVDPPRTKWVRMLGVDTYLTEDAPGSLGPGEFKRRFSARNPAR